jgi:hypothetical protein
MLSKLAQQGGSVSPNKSPTYAPAVFASHSGGLFTSKEFAAAMERLLERRAIHVVTEGSPSRRREHIAEGPPSL